jgi:GNAT superfamily N-acetyltransferase
MDYPIAVNNMINIREAILSDCKRIMELVHELAEYEKAPQEVTVTLEHFTESGFGENRVWWALVAEETETNTILGFALYYIRFSTWKGQRMYLEDLLVTQESRGKGIGSLLMNALKTEAKAKGLTAICWQVLDWNEPAINFYKKHQASFDNEWVNCVMEV